MSETIKWSALKPEQRDGIVAEKVMNWQKKPCDGEQGEVSGGWFCTKCGYDGNWGDSFEHMELPPRYTQSLDAAWLVLQEMVKRKEPDENEYRISTQFEAFTKHMLVASEWDDSTVWSEIYPASEIFVMAAKWTPEAICLAALRAVGVEIEVQP